MCLTYLNSQLRNYIAYQYIKISNTKSVTYSLLIFILYYTVCCGLLFGLYVDNTFIVEDRRTQSLPFRKMSSYGTLPLQIIKRKVIYKELISCAKAVSVLKEIIYKPSDIIKCINVKLSSVQHLSNLTELIYPFRTYFLCFQLIPRSTSSGFPPMSVSVERRLRIL